MAEGGQLSVYRRDERAAAVLRRRSPRTWKGAASLAALAMGGPPKESAVECSLCP